MSSQTISLAAELIKKASVTPDDAGCQPQLAARLEAIGFNCQPIRHADVDNLWARRGTDKPLFVFAGHTDVVPVGNPEDWNLPPFDAVIQDGMLHGRGAADMKGSLAAMVTATERFVGAHPQHSGSIAFLLTSDEEGPAVDGTVRIVDMLTQQDEQIDFCVVGEPTSSDRLGDVIKNGRRGSLSAHMTLKGKQGHVAYPHLADNPIHRMATVINALATESWDEGNAFFPPTTFQISNIRSGTGANNVIPNAAEVWFNFRFSTESTAETLKRRTLEIVQSCKAEADFDWSLSGQPFLTSPGILTTRVSDAIKSITGVDTELSTSGGTSDARFIAPTGAEVIELGPINATIHKVDECISTADLDTLSSVYEKTLENLLLKD